MARFLFSAASLALVLMGSVVPALAQMTTIGTPLQGTRSSFFEGINSGWSVRGPNFFASFGGGGNNAAPQFGGYMPNAGIQSGFTFGGGPFSGNFNFGAAQGASQSFTSETPLLTTMNGQPGSLFIGRERPFVTSLVPIVGPGVVAYAPVVSGVPQYPQLAPLAPQLPWKERLAAQGGLRPVTRNDREEAGLRMVKQDARQAEAAPAALIDDLPPTRAEREQKKSAEEAARLASAQSYFDKGVDAEQSGKPSVAKLYFEMAARRADGSLKAEAEQRAKSLSVRR
ncbi:MAG: hypothetical protein IT428_02770 [Planctomycetaceae bacterium]|nr:hypothetical protein [Planctomycetaceae bacterium]